MRQVYLAQSPLQVLSAAEARHAFSDGTDHLLIIMLSPTRRENNRQVLLAVSSTHWQHVCVFHPDKGIPLHALITKWRLYSMLRRLRNQQQVYRLFMGDFRSLWMHRARAVLEPAEAWLMDDGSITSVVQRDFLNRDIFFPPQKKRGLQALIKPVIHRLMNTHQTAVQPLHVFSCFPVDEPIQPERQLLRHRFDSLRATSRERPRLAGQIYFFGTKLSETGTLERPQEVRLLAGVAQQYRARGLTMTYVPHRGDSSEKLTLIHEHGIPVHALGMPAELYMTCATELPVGIATFNSSAVTTLNMLADFDIVEAFQIPPTLFSADKREQQRHAYELLQSQNIPVHLIIDSTTTSDTPC